ncbi:MAG: hypothetical protein FJ104_07930 [Deltaproteobacteria bacterium]|nr:hypothetical protein [Deltaproteobacteria bacterium]
MPSGAVTTATALTVRVEVEPVPERSAAWRALWRELFTAIEAELAANDGARDTEHGAHFSSAEEQA